MCCGPSNRDIDRWDAKHHFSGLAQFFSCISPTLRQFPSLKELTFLSEQDKDWIMGRAILARLGWT
jgi:hypothetical protein